MPGRDRVRGSLRVAVGTLRPLRSQPTATQIMSRTNVRQSNARSVAGEVVRRVVEDDAFSQLALSHALDASTLDARDRGFATHLVYGTLTYLGAIDRILDERLKSGLSSVQPAAAAAMRLAVFELFFADERPPSAIIVNEAVSALPPRTPKSLRGLVNGVLRNLVRNGERVREAIRPYERLGVPPWMERSLLDVVTEPRAAKILSAWNQPSRTWIRSMLDVGELEALFEEHGRTLGPHPTVPFAFAIEGSVGETPGLNEQFIVQDPGAQLAGWLCSAELGVSTVVDACAGLGSKSLHLHEIFPAAAIHAIDDKAAKLKQLPENPQIAIHAAALGTDSGRDQLAWLEEQADVVLVDAPCSALGTIGRHPEIRWKRTPEGIHTLARQQRSILAHAADFVRPGGLLVYGVCTWTREETDEVVAAFLAENEAFRLEPYKPMDGADAADGTLRTFPDVFPTDGFFYARLRRRAAPAAEADGTNSA